MTTNIATLSPSITKAVEHRISDVFGDQAQSINVSSKWLGGYFCLTIQGQAPFFDMAISAFKADVVKVPGALMPKARREAWPFLEAIKAGKLEDNVSVDIHYCAYFTNHDPDSFYAFEAMSQIAGGFPVWTLFREKSEELLRHPHVRATLTELGISADSFCEEVEVCAMDTIGRMLADTASPGCAQSKKTTAWDFAETPSTPSA